MAKPTDLVQGTLDLLILKTISLTEARLGDSEMVSAGVPPDQAHLHYVDTMQSSCLRLMAKKMLVSLAMEGKFSDGGLQSFEEDDDMLTAMARELVTEHGIGESADVLWRQLQVEQSRVLPAPPAAVADESELDSIPSPLPP